jgi:hypothetical protein
MPGSAIGQELDLVEQATFTDPSDQSAWIYHRWLLSQALQRYKGAEHSEPQQQHVAYQVCTHHTQECACVTLPISTCARKFAATSGDLMS